MLKPKENSKNNARKLLNSKIDHNTFWKAFERRWHVGTNGELTKESEAWFFCWAMTGMNSERTMLAIRQLFEPLFGLTFEKYKSTANYKEAKRIRYLG